MPGSLRLGKIAEIEVYAHLSWFIILVLLTWSLADDWFAQLFPGWSTTTYWIAAFISALLLFVCVLLHELAHAFVAQAHGATVRNITLFIFGGVAHIKEEMKHPGVGFQAAIAGPIASFLLAVIAFLLALPLRGSGASAEVVLEYLAVSNFLLGIFNLIPGFPLDGGRVLRSIIWKVTGNFRKATRIATYVGQGGGYVFILLGIIEFFTGNFFNGLWTAFIGWFLLSAAQSTYVQVEVESMLQGVSVQQAMNPQPVTVPANISLQKLVDDFFLPQGLRSAPVTQGDYLMGLITFADFVRLPREHWAYTPVGHIMRLLEQVHTAAPEQSLQEVLEMMSAQDINQVPVVQDGRLVGLLNRESILRSLQARQRLHYRQRKRATQHENCCSCFHSQARFSKITAHTQTLMLCLLGGGACKRVELYDDEHNGVLVVAAFGPAMATRKRNYFSTPAHSQPQFSSITVLVHTKGLYSLHFKTSEDVLITAYRWNVVSL